MGSDFPNQKINVYLSHATYNTSSKDEGTTRDSHCVCQYSPTETEAETLEAYKEWYE